MKKLAFFLLIAACLGAGGVKAAAEPAQPAKTPKAVHCEAPAGSRIRPQLDAQGRCPQGSAPVRSYSREDIQQTGQIDLDRALQQLDPSLSRSGQGLGGRP